MSDESYRRDRIKKLQKHREIIAKRSEEKEKRLKVGGRIIGLFNEAFESNYRLDEFDFTRESPSLFHRPPSFDKCHGLVLAYVSEKRIKEVVKCCDEKLGKLSGLVGFDEYSYMGSIHINCKSLVHMLRAAFSIQDSIIFFPENYNAVILVDYYDVRGESRDRNFSLVVQGEKLELELASCFDNVAHFK